MATRCGVNVLNSISRPFRASPSLPLRPSLSTQLLRPYPHLPRTLQPAHAQLGRRFAHAIPKPQSRTPAVSPEEDADTPEKPRKLLEPHYELTFTCVPCGSRSTHAISKQGYHNGSVLITCPSCRNRHVISDHLNIFGDRKMTVEDLMKERGQLVKRGTLGEDGDVEFWEDGTVTERGKSADTGPAQLTQPATPGGLARSGMRPKLDNASPTATDATPSAKRQYWTKSTSEIPLEKVYHIPYPMKKRPMSDAIGFKHPVRVKKPTYELTGESNIAPIDPSAPFFKDSVAPMREPAPDAIGLMYPAKNSARHGKADMPEVFREPRKPRVGLGTPFRDGTDYARAHLADMDSKPLIREVATDAAWVTTARQRLEEGEWRSIASKDPYVDPYEVYRNLKNAGKVGGRKDSKTRDEYIRDRDVDPASASETSTGEAFKDSRRLPLRTQELTNKSRIRFRPHSAPFQLRFVQPKKPARNRTVFVRPDLSPTGSSLADASAAYNQVSESPRRRVPHEELISHKAPRKMPIMKHFAGRKVSRNFVYAWPENSAVPIKIEIPQQQPERGRRRVEKQTISKKATAQWKEAMWREEWLAGTESKTMGSVG